METGQSTATGEWKMVIDWCSFLRTLVPKGYISPFGSALLVNPASVLLVVSRDEYARTLECPRRIYLRPNRSTHGEFSVQYSLNSNHPATGVSIHGDASYILINAQPSNITGNVIVRN